MKKLFALLICTVMLMLSALPLVAEEAENFLGEIGEIPCPFGTPTIDGRIDATEGWSAAQYIDKTNTDGAWGGEEVVITGNIYRAYDDKNLYIAADINIPEFSMCEELDWIEGNLETGNKPGWDGDVFVLSVDPLGKMVEEGLGNDPAPWYCFGLFDGNNIRTYRTHVNEQEITETTPAAGSTTETGWRFEAAIAWDTICKDIDGISYGDIVLSPEDVAKEGNRIHSAMIYYDRVFDDEAGERITGSRYATICTTCPDGLSGTTATPWLSKTHGMFLKLEAKKTEESTADTTVSTDTTAQNNETEVVTDNKGNIVTDASGNKVTQKVNKTTTKKATTGAATGTNAAQTFDIGIAVALGALASSGIGIMAARKRK